jgi:hypothetical protein
MSGNVVALRFSDDNVAQTPLEALLGELARTSARVVWLERIVDSLGLSELFGDQETTETTEMEGQRVGRPGPNAGAGERVKWLLQQERQKSTVATRKRLAVHPAYTTYFHERKHLVDLTSRLMGLGIKLDHIELTKRQGEQMVSGMVAFAQLSGLDVESDVVKSAIARAIESVAV